MIGYFGGRIVVGALMIAKANDADVAVAVARNPDEMHVHGAATLRTRMFLKMRLGSRDFSALDPSRD